MLPAPRSDDSRSVDVETVGAGPDVPSDVSLETATDGSPTDLIEGSAVLLVGFGKDSAELADAVRRLAARGRHAAAPVEAVDSFEGAHDVLGRTPVAAIVLRMTPILRDGASEFFDQLATRHPFQRVSLTVFGLDDLSILQPLVQDDRVFYAAADVPGGVESVARLVVASLADFTRRLVVELTAGRSKDPRVEQRRRLSTIAAVAAEATDVGAVVEPAREALEDIVGIDGLRLWLHDRTRDTLRLEDGSDSGGRLDDGDAVHDEVSAATGLVGFVVRTGEAVRLERAVDDPRRDPESDGSPEALLAVPIAGPEGVVLGALCASRASAPFDADDEAFVARVADHLAPLCALAAPRPHDQILRATTSGSAPPIFRREAVEAHAEGFGRHGQLLDLTPGWARWTWRVLVASVVVALAFVALVPIARWVELPATVAAVDAIRAEATPRDAARLEVGDPARFVPVGDPDGSIVVVVRELSDSQVVAVPRGIGDAEARALVGTEGTLQVRTGSQPILLGLLDGDSR